MLWIYVMWFGSMAFEKEKGVPLGWRLPTLDFILDLTIAQGSGTSRATGSRSPAS
jgi:hypothetical protein